MEQRKTHQFRFQEQDIIIPSAANEISLASGEDHTKIQIVQQSSLFWPAAMVSASLLAVALAITLKEPPTPSPMEATYVTQNILPEAEAPMQTVQSQAQSPAITMPDTNYNTHSVYKDDVATFTDALRNIVTELRQTTSPVVNYQNPAINHTARPIEAAPRVNSAGSQDSSALSPITKVTVVPVSVPIGVVGYHAFESESPVETLQNSSPAPAQKSRSKNPTYEELVEDTRRNGSHMFHLR